MEDKVVLPNFKKFYLFSFIPFLMALYLIYAGVRNLKLFPGNELALQIMFCYLPVIFAVFIIIVIIYLYFDTSQKRLVFTKDTVLFSQPGKKNIIRVNWKELIFIQPQRGKKHFRQMILSNGEQSIKIDDFFYPEFSVILEKVAAIRDEFKKKDADFEI